MQYVGAVGSIISGVAKYRQGRQEAANYHLESVKAKVAADRKALQHEQKKTEIMRELRMRNSTIVATAGAGGIDPFSGSASLLRATNNSAFGRDYRALTRGADSALRLGDVQALQYVSAGQSARRSGTFDALVTLTTGYVGYKNATKGSGTG
jgi:hypothetical protein